MPTKTTTTTTTATKTTKATPTLTPLQRTWTTLYRDTLPALALHRPDWPVKLDHCFARIILDNAVGVDAPWAEKVKAPATWNMSEEQLRGAVELGERIVRGEVDLGVLDRRSLQLRGKGRGKGGVAGASEKGGVGKGERSSGGEKRKADVLGDTDIWRRWRFKGVDVEDVKAEEAKPPTPERNPTISHSKDKQIDATKTPPKATSPPPNQNDPKPTQTAPSKADEEQALRAIRARIASDPSLTPFRAHVLTLLTQVPRGRHTTYKALADAIPLTKPPRPIKSSSEPTSTASSKLAPTSASTPSSSCARAIGSAMRNNPFAPTVPCHRVLASDGKIGGFGGDWGEEGRFVGEKRRLLREEGVGFDGRGRVLGRVFTGFV